MAIRDFGYFSILIPKAQNYDFLNICLLNPKVESYPKTGTYVVKPHTDNTHTKLQSNIFRFGCAMVKQAGKGYDVTF